MSAAEPEADLPDDAMIGASVRAPARRGPRAAATRALVWPAWGIAALCAAPMLSVLLTAAFGDWETLSLLSNTVLPRYAQTTLLLALMVGVGVGLIGVGAAVLVTGFKFPGRRIFEVALIAPLAFPAYVLAYAYTALLDHPGPVQSALREVTGWGPREYWFPEVRSLEGAAMMLTLVLYPYVYLLTRAALLQQSVTAAHVARTLGAGPWAVLFRVTLPMARPAIVGGMALALMETVADYGTVAHFGVQTFATGVFRAWFSMGDRVAAAQVAACLLILALTLAALERAQRGAVKRHPTGRRHETAAAVRLKGPYAAAATFLCSVPVAFGFVIPLLMLSEMALEAVGEVATQRYLEFAARTATLAGVAALLATFGALMISYAGRLAPGPGARAAELSASVGYAVPGGVIAVGLLVPLAWADNTLDGFMRETFGVSTGLILTGSAAALLLGYLARFMAASLNAVSAGFETVRPNLDASARVLGRSVWGVAREVHAPLLRGSLLTSALIVFVDVTKELPATLIMRPFNFDTLAVRAHNLASDERLAEASIPSLALAAVGLVPVVLIARSIRRARLGRQWD